MARTRPRTRIRPLLALLAAAGCALLGVTQAAAAGPAAVAPRTPSVLTTVSPSGPAVPVGGAITGTLASGTQLVIQNALSMPTFKIVCSAANLATTVTTNPPTPGTATLALGGLTISSCAASPVPAGITGINNVSLTLPSGLTLTAGAPVTFGASQLTLSLKTLLGAVTCVYTAPGITAAQSNADNSVAVTLAPYTKSSGAGLCPTTMYLSAKWVLRYGGAPVFVD